MCNMTKAQLFQGLPYTVGVLWMVLSESRLSMHPAAAHTFHGPSLKHGMFFKPNLATIEEIECLVREGGSGRVQR
jgi:hypothetical protein